MDDLEEHVLEDLYTWIDEIPLSRPKRDLKRDFSDGVLVAEIIKHFIPHIVEMHNYSSALAVNKKLVNWHIMNRKVFRKLGFEVNEEIVKNIINCQPFAVEHFLILLRKKIEQMSSTHRTRSEVEHQDNPVVPSDSLIRKAASADSQRVRSTAPKTSESDNVSPGQLSSTTGSAVPRKVAGGIVKQLPGDAQVRQLLAEKDEQLKARDETIEIMQAKIHRLEQLLQLKEIRIEDLQARLSEAKSYSFSAQPRKIPSKTK